MFITKKKFNKMLEEEVSKMERELNERRRIDDEFRYVHEDMNHSFEYVRRDIGNLEDRISKIEKELHPEPEKKCCCENQAVNAPCTIGY